jgi:hypothetical protein
VNYNQHVSKMIERQQTKRSRKIHHALAELNLSLNELHRSILPTLEVDKYIYATEYVNTYISYTDIWNLKFVYNLENPEVALLQFFHLDYIFIHEPADRYVKERASLLQLKEDFKPLNPFKEDKMVERFKKMIEYIQSKQ